VKVTEKLVKSIVLGPDMIHEIKLMGTSTATSTIELSKLSTLKDSAHGNGYSRGHNEGQQLAHTGKYDERPAPKGGSRRQQLTLPLIGVENLPDIPDDAFHCGD